MKKLNFLLLVLFAVSLSPLPAQEFSSIDGDLQALEDLIADTLKSAEEQQKLLEDLQRNLSESGNLIENYESIISRQEQLLAGLRKQLNEMSETYRKQSALSERYAQNSKFWRTFTLIAVPLATGLGIWIGTAVSK